MSATLPAKLFALPESWVERIFGRMESLYGSLFLDRWRGTDMAQVKRTWSEELARFSDHPACFGDALAAMIDEFRLPPTLPEFVSLCRRKYQSPHAGIGLPAPAPLSSAEAAKRMEKIGASMNKPAGYDYRSWAKELRTRYLSGENLLPIQERLASEALGEVWANRECKPILEAA